MTPPTPRPVLTLVFISLTILVNSGFGFNDDTGILKWNPRWLSYNNPIRSKFNSRDSLYKRVTEDERGTYKWSPLYFSYPSHSFRQQRPVGYGSYFAKRTPISEYSDSDGSYEQQNDAD